jgi:hypothetical protein
MRVDQVRREVAEFREKNAFGNRVEDCFPAFLAALVRTKSSRERILDWGQALIDKKNKDFRNWVGQQMDNRHMRIQGALKGRFLALDDASADTLDEAFAGALRDIGIRAPEDVFEAFVNLDDHIET